MKAAVVVCLGLLLLVPTFNALNASYVENVPPPPWLPTPPTPPDITPPSNFKPPTGMTPPTNYKGEIPPGACPPPVIEHLIADNRTIPTQGTPMVLDYPFKIPNGSIGFQGYINWTDWRAQRIFAQVTGPTGFKSWANDTYGNDQARVLASPTPTASTKWEYNSYKLNNGQMPKAGEYNLRLTADFPIDGKVSFIFAVAKACGGMLS